MKKYLGLVAIPFLFSNLCHAGKIHIIRTGFAIELIQLKELSKLKYGTVLFSKTGTMVFVGEDILDRAVDSEGYLSYGTTTDDPSVLFDSEESRQEGTKRPTPQAPKVSASTVKTGISSLKWAPVSGYHMAARELTNSIVSVSVGTSQEPQVIEGILLGYDGHSPCRVLSDGIEFKIESDSIASMRIAPQDVQDRRSIWTSNVSQLNFVKKYSSWKSTTNSKVIRGNVAAFLLKGAPGFDSLEGVVTQIQDATQYDPNTVYTIDSRGQFYMIFAHQVQEIRVNVPESNVSF